MGKQTHQLEVETLHDGYRTTAYFAKGHHDFDPFREELRREYVRDDRTMPEGEAYHGWGRWVPATEDDDFHMRYLSAVEGRPGAFPVTMLDVG